VEFNVAPDIAGVSVIRNVSQLKAIVKEPATALNEFHSHNPQQKSDENKLCRLDKVDVKLRDSRMNLPFEQQSLTNESVKRQLQNEFPESFFLPQSNRLHNFHPANPTETSSTRISVDVLTHTCAKPLDRRKTVEDGDAFSYLNRHSSPERHQFTPNSPRTNKQ
jgi:hypothetical protein